MCVGGKSREGRYDSEVIVKEEEEEEEGEEEEGA